MYNNLSYDLLAVAPELFQMSLMTMLLVFALVFNTYSHNCSRRVFDHAAGFHNCIYQSFDFKPTLQVQSILLVIIICLACCCVLYANQPLDDDFLLITCDDLSRFASLILCASSAIVLGLCYQSFNRLCRYEFVFLIWFSIMAMLLLLRSINLLFIYLCVELQSLTFYMLAATKSKSEANSEAGLKYFILGAFSSAFLLLGCTLCYASTGTLNLNDIAILVHTDVLLLQYTICLSIGVACIVISFLFKLAASPFHSWIADIYDGSLLPVTAFFATCSHIATLSIFIRLSLLFHMTSYYFLVCVALLSLCFGTFNALRQVHITRLIAYSSINTAAWFIMCLVVQQYHLLLVYLTIYITTNLGLFAILTVPLFRSYATILFDIRRYTYTKHLPHSPQSAAVFTQFIHYISDLHMLCQTNFCCASVLAICFFSLAGIPPLAGFYTKYLVLSAVILEQHYLLAFVALATALIASWYYVNLVKVMFFTTAQINTVNVVTKHLNTATGPRSFASAIFAYVPFKHSHTQLFSLNILPFNAYVASVASMFSFAFFIRPDFLLILFPSVI